MAHTFYLESSNTVWNKFINHQLYMAVKLDSFFVRLFGFDYESKSSPSFLILSSTIKAPNSATSLTLFAISSLRRRQNCKLDFGACHRCILFISIVECIFVITGVVFAQRTRVDGQRMERSPIERPWRTQERTSSRESKYQDLDPAGGYK